MSQNAMIHLAKDVDSETLKKYYETHSLKGIIEFQQTFKKSYFDLYHLLSDEHYTFKMEDSEILGSVTFIIKEVVLEGRLRRVAFSKNLRISNQRQAILGWSENYHPMLEKMRREYHCEYIFSYINDLDTNAKSTFVRPKKIRSFYPRYHFFRKASLITLHGQYPWAKDPLPELKVIKCTSMYEDALVYYLIQNSKNHELNSLSGPDAFYKTLERMNGLKIQDFWIALDYQDNIVGALAPWNIESLLSLKTISLSNSAKNFKQFSDVVRYLGWARPLTSTLQMTFLSFIHCDHPDIFETLLWKVWKETPKNHFMVYSYARLNFKYRRPLSWISVRIPHSLYSILDPQETPPHFLHPANERTIESDTLLMW